MDVAPLADADFDPDVTAWLSQLPTDATGVNEQLFTLLYQELRSIARNHLRREAEVAMVEMAFTIAAEYARATGGSLDVAETMRAAQRRPSAWERAVDTAAKLAA